MRLKQVGSRLRIRRNNLRTRTAAAMAVTVGASLAATLLLLAWGAERYLRLDIERRARDYAALSTPAVGASYETYGASGLYKLGQQVGELMSHSEDVTSIRVLSVTGQVLFDSQSLGGAGETKEPAADDAWVLDAVRTVELAARPIRFPGGEQEYEIASPFIEDWGGHRLCILYRFSYRKLRSRFAEATPVLGGISAATVVLAFLVGGLMARRVSQPLAELTQRVQDVGAGRFGHRVEVREGAAEELRLLAQAFNAMAGDLDLHVESLKASNARLSEVNALLEAKIAELERFTYTVSHELRSPLVTILSFLGFVERAVEVGEGNRARADFERIRAAAMKMEQLLRDLLELSRVGLVSASPQKLDLGALAREVVTALAPAVAHRGVEVRVAAGLPTVWADPARMREVLQNLLENAVKFMGSQPHPAVTIGARGRDTAGQQVLFVSDNGIGVEPRHRERIFALFEKLEPASEGSGVGLAIVKRIIEGHGGRTWVESEGLGHGSAFCFTLPETDPDEPSRDAPRPA